MRWLLVLLAFCCSVASAQPMIKVVKEAWAGLSQDERNLIQQKYLIELAPLSSFGIIIDVQGINQSTPGTTAGSAIGQAYANAAYLDKSIRDRSYSAQGQLAAGLIGGLVGSTMDQAPVSRFYFRYAVRLGDGNVQYVDQVSGDPFRHPPGVCVTYPEVALVPDQQLCAQTPDALRAIYLGASPIRPTAVDALQASPTQGQTQRSTEDSTELPATEGSNQVSCKVGSSAPVRATAQKCALVNGLVIP